MSDELQAYDSVFIEDQGTYALCPICDEVVFEGRCTKCDAPVADPPGMDDA